MEDGVFNKNIVEYMNNHWYLVYYSDMINDETFYYNLFINNNELEIIGNIHLKDIDDS